MIDITKSLPIKLTSERVWRTYIGGRLLDEFHGKEEGEDGHFPEEWIMSVVSARNVGRENIVEGLSKLSDNQEISLKDLIDDNPEFCLGEKHVHRYGTHPGVLVKLIDSAERLTIQVHPNRQQAKKLFESPFGKTECWHILDGRIIDGKDPCVYLGFKEGVTKEHWINLFQKQDITGMLECLHRFEVKKGDTILIEGGVPHAIGAGCMLAEIQEPSDYTIRVERTTPSGYNVADELCHQGLGFERMFDCFNFEGLSREEVRKRWFCTDNDIEAREGGSITSLLSYKETPFFRLHLLEVYGALLIPSYSMFSGIYVLDGEGKIIIDEQVIPLTKGDQYFLPSKLKDFTIISTGKRKLKILNYFGPKLS